MNNELQLVSTKMVLPVKSLIAKQKLSQRDIQEIVDSLDAHPIILNHLSLEEVSKLSVLGIDLSKYMGAVHLNNIKVFVVKFASETMTRVSKLTAVLNEVEEKYYKKALDSKDLHPRVASEIISQIQESITASVNLMMKLTDNETLMNLFIVSMNGVNDTINENRNKGYTSSLDLLPLDSRRKLDSVVSILISALNESAAEPAEVINAVFEEKNEQ